MDKNYYKILGVSETASQDEIKRAYRRKAHQYHPDKGGGDEAKFKQVNQAYQVLSNSQKRRQYDTFGSAGFGAGQTGFGGFSGGQGGFGGFDFGDIFGAGRQSGTGSGFSFSFDGLGDIFEDFFGQSMAQVQAEVKIKLTQALLGDTLEFQTQSGEKIALKIPPHTQDGTSFRLRGKGREYRGKRGDLIITVRIDLPRRLSWKQKKLMQELKKAGL